MWHGGAPPCRACVLPWPLTPCAEANQCGKKAQASQFPHEETGSPAPSATWGGVILLARQKAQANWSPHACEGGDLVEVASLVSNSPTEEPLCHCLLSPDQGESNRGLFTRAVPGGIAKPPGAER